MKKIFPAQQHTLSFFITMAGIVFLLQSCCCLGRPSSTSKYCDCGKRNLAFEPGKEKNEQPTRPVEKNETTAGTVEIGSEATINAMPAGIVEAVMIASDNEAADVPVTETGKIMPLILADQVIQTTVAERSPGAFKKIKKLPLGIKAMNTHIVAGPCMSFKSSKEDYGTLDHKHKSGIGFQFGVKSTFTFSEKLDLSSALLVKQNNASEVISYSTTGEPGGGSSTQEYESKYSYTYLSAPLMAEVKLSDQFTVMAGPELSLLLAASVKEGGDGSGSEKTDIKDNSVKTGIGVQAGIKYVIPGSPLVIQLIYDHRISRLNEKSSDYYPGGGYETPAWNMKSIQLGVACSICALLTGKK